MTNSFCIDSTSWQSTVITIYNQTIDILIIRII